MDIAYCTCKSCPCKDCRRHPSRCPVGVPVTMADMDEKDDRDGSCLYYWPTKAQEE